MRAHFVLDRVPRDRSSGFRVPVRGRDGDPVPFTGHEAAAADLTFLPPAVGGTRPGTDRSWTSP